MLPDPRAVPDPISVPPSRPLPAPIAAPLAPPINAPAAAPTAVPRAAVPTPLRMEAWFGVVFICSVAYCWQEASSARNSSKDLPEPGSAMMLGPLGMVAQEASSRTSKTGATRLYTALQAIGIVFPWLIDLKAGEGPGSSP